VKDVVPAQPDAITKIILKDGVAYKTPNDHSEVTVSWAGRLEDGTVFDEVCKSPRGGWQ
jgi:FKBP-type peptidyl-prolyl cis-trans isomerase